MVTSGQNMGRFSCKSGLGVSAICDKPLKTGGILQQQLISDAFVTINNNDRGDKQ